MKDSCPLYGQFKNIFEYCTNDLNSLSQDRKSYGFGWSKFNQSYIPPYGYQAMYNSFQFQDSDSLQGLPIEGKFSTYEGSGYVYELRGQLSYIQGNLSLLKQMNWVDRQTRAVFVEFSVFNPNINLVMVSTILVEFLSSGSILTSARFDPLNLFSDIGGSFVSFKTLSEVAFIVFIIYFMILEIKHLMKRNLKEYLSDFWTFVEWAIIASAWVSFSMMIVRYVTALEVLDFFKNTAGFGYMKLQKVNECNQTLTYSLALCASLGCIKFLKLLRFNRRINYLGATLNICMEELIFFSCIEQNKSVTL